MNAGKWAEEAQALLDKTLRSQETCSLLGLYETSEVSESRVEMLFDQVSSGFKAGRGESGRMWGEGRERGRERAF